MNIPLIKLKNDEYRIVCKILDIFKANTNLSTKYMLSNGLNFNVIKNFLKLDGIEVSDEILHKCIQYLYVTKGMLVRDCFIGKDDEYRLLLDEYYFQSSYQEYYRHFESVINIKKLILISDTHKYGKEIEDDDKINGIYEYAKSIDGSLIFHLGDLFDKENKEIQIDSLEFYLKQIGSFVDSYPKEVDTYGILGNHDKNINKFFQSRECESFDLRGLSYYNPKFYMFPHDEMQVDIGNKKFHFAHRLFFNTMIRKAKIESLGDVHDYLNYMSISEYDIHISGHLHDGFIYTADDEFFNKQNLYIGVPSLNNKNDSCIAIQLNLDYFDDDLVSINIIPLYFVNNLVVPGEGCLWDIRERNKQIRKRL